MSTWDEDCEAHINAMLAKEDASEVIAHAISEMIACCLDLVVMAKGGKSHNGCDPQATMDFNQRLLVACIDEIRGKR
jgi:hypothetical protein